MLRLQYLKGTYYHSNAESLLTIMVLTFDPCLLLVLQTKNGTFGKINLKKSLRNHSLHAKEKP